MDLDKFERVIGDALQLEPMKEMNLKFLGVGAEKIVFETPGSERKIVKVYTGDVLSKIKNVILGRAPQNTEETQLKIIREVSETEKIISDVFGVEHILRRGFFRAKIPFSKEVMLHLLKHADVLPEIKQRVDEIDPHAVFVVETIAETQIKAKELLDVEKYKTEDLRSRLMIDQNFREDVDIPRALNSLAHFIDKVFIEDFDTDHPHMEYRETFKEIIQKMIKYTKQTGEMLDIFGRNNITVFTDENGGINYHLLDVILPGRREGWVQNIKDDPELDNLRFYFTYYYSVKRLAEKLGVDETISLDDLVYFKGSIIPTNWK